MAIVQKSFEVGGRLYVRTYSDAGFYIHGGFPEADYEDAIDPASAGRTYTETDIPIVEEDEQVDAAEIVDILMGVEE